MIHAVYETILAAHAVGKPVSVCGEMAGDPVAALLLIGMGIDTLSMSASSLNRVKWLVQSFSTQRAREILDEVRQMDDAARIRNFLNNELEQVGLGGLIRAGR